MELLPQKLALYSTLIRIPSDKMTDGDVDIMYALSKDKDIQNHFEKRKEGSHVST